MTNDLYLGVAISIIGYLMLFATGINGIRHARIMGLGFDGYAMSSIWLWIAFSGSLNLFISLRLITAHGVPTAIKFASGHMEPFTFGLRNWTMLAVGFLIVCGLCLRSFVMVRNAKRITRKTREAVRQTDAAFNNLEQAMKGGKDA